MKKKLVWLKLYVQKEMVRIIYRWQLRKQRKNTRRRQ
jgi:hypothetical protein